MEALRFVDDLYEMFRGMHDGFINAMSLMHAKLAEANGEEWLEGFTRDRIYPLWRPIFLTMKNMSPEQQVNAICGTHRPMYSEFHVEEDDEKFVVAVIGCRILSCNGGNNSMTKENKLMKLAGIKYISEDYGRSII